MFILKVAQCLKAENIKYAVVGGYAVALHGVTRGTVDIDLVIAFSKANLNAVQSALQSLGLVSRLPVNADSVFDFRKEYIRDKNLVAWSFYNPAHPLECVDILITEDLKDLEVDRLRFAGELIPVVSKKDLIKMKRKSGRPQDLEDVKALESLK